MGYSGQGQKKRLVVSGAGGFLGQKIVESAGIRGLAVFAISSHPERLADVPAIKTEDFLAGGVELCAQDVFINCVFPTNADGEHMANGLEKVFAITSQARDCGAGAFVNVSSQSVYPTERKVPAVEGDALSLDKPYAVGKYSSEAFTNRVFKDVPHTNIRLASLIGAGYDQRIINRLAAKALLREPLRVMGGMQRYGFLDVNDASRGFVALAMSDPEDWDEIYNLGTNASYSFVDLVECVLETTERLTGHKGSFEILEGEDWRNSSLDSSRFMRDFGWRPEMSLAASTEAIVREKLAKIENCGV